MFPRIFFLLFICGCFPVDCVPPASPFYRKAELALRHYSSQPSYNPVIYSLLNVLIHDKQAKPFISERAIEMALEHVKQLDQTVKINNERSLRQIIYGSHCKPSENNCANLNQRKTHKLTADLKERITSALDKLFAGSNLDNNGTLSTVNKNKS